MATTIDLGGVTVEVVKKDIRNLHLSVYPPSGRVRISAPLRMKLDTIRVFTITKLGWIRQQQRKLRDQQRETPREYLDRESHYLWGKRYLLQVIEIDGAAMVEVRHNRLVLQVRRAASNEKKQAVLEEWYREQLKRSASLMIDKWEPIIGVKIERFFAQRMKTKWGSCRPESRSIRLNTDLAKKPPQCLEYIVVHEMLHVIEPTHNRRFVTLMDQFIPQWRFCRAELNRLPVRHEDWAY